MECCASLANSSLTTNMQRACYMLMLSWIFAVSQVERHFGVSDSTVLSGIMASGRQKRNDIFNGKGTGPAAKATGLRHTAYKQLTDLVDQKPVVADDEDETSPSFLERVKVWEGRLEDATKVCRIATLDVHLDTAQRFMGCPLLRRSPLMEKTYLSQKNMLIWSTK